MDISLSQEGLNLGSGLAPVRVLSLIQAPVHVFSAHFPSWGSSLPPPFPVVPSLFKLFPSSRMTPSWPSWLPLSPASTWVARCLSFPLPVLSSPVPLPQDVRAAPKLEPAEGGRAKLTVRALPFPGAVSASGRGRQAHPAEDDVSKASWLRVSNQLWSVLSRS